MPMKNPPHPGLSVRHDCLEPLGLSVTEAARKLGVSRKQLSDIVNGRSGISPEMAIRLDKAFGGGAATWARLQAAYDLAQAMRHADRNQGQAVDACGVTIGWDNRRQPTMRFVPALLLTTAHDGNARYHIPTPRISTTSRCIGGSLAISAFEKFVWLVQHGRLFMPRANRLGDPLEGTTPDGELNWWRNAAATADTEEERRINKDNRALPLGNSRKHFEITTILSVAGI